MDKHIEKSVFLAALECPTKGWKAGHSNRGDISPALRWRFLVGNEIGEAARRQLGQGTMVRRTPIDEAVAATGHAIESGATLLFEASFAHESFVARADAIRKSGAGWELIEVKSGKAPSDGPPKASYIDDIAYTAFVCRSRGLLISKCTLMLITPGYRLEGQLPLLTEVDVTERALKRAVVFEASAKEVARVITSDVATPPVFEFVCKECDYFEDECVGKNMPESLFILPRLSKKLFDKVKQFESVSRLPLTIDLSPPQERVATVFRTRQPFVNPAILNTLDGVEWPIHYLDFESVNPALPWFHDCESYEAIPFQYSVHIRETAAAQPTHHEFLAEAQGDWRQPLAASLVRHLGDRGSVFTYTGYEKRMLGYLSERVPDYSDALKQIVGRLFDLEGVVDGGYCHAGFKGRTSIKNVLPVVAPDLSYKGLNIANGDHASAVFALMRLGEYPAADHLKHRTDLLQYCKLDTLAMVRVHDGLLELKGRSGA